MAYEKSSYHKKWWVKTIRERNFFGFRYWWFNWSAWILACFLLLYGVFFQTDIDNSSCLDRYNLSRGVADIDKAMEKCCSCNKINIPIPIPIPIDSTKRRINDTIQKEPTQNCRVHFSGLIMGGEAVDNNISKIYKEDFASEYVGGGFYKSNQKAFPKSVKTTFDGIAVDKGTRLIIYSRKNYKGQVLLDIKGPAIINNVIWKDDSRYNHCNTEDYPTNLQSNYPQNVRIWSVSNMHQWSFGSCKIICDQ